ncbi:hypothetical protein [Actibacterium sp. 188UL27-1]|uniref:hypothetical protein n=1 Tax=Actibacterium sp. 188UL27-1 TaxID=2786961 RepID=UPI00195C6416|nr:hypothetical protein [Actibacterium sp. 188UL27-1]MBM7067438.1 hypothetical protein [Actibacterium sp. 188UL27-1]
MHQLFWAFGAAIAMAAPLLADPKVDRFVDDIAACLGTAPLDLVIAGLPNDQTALSAAQAASLRLSVEEALSATGRVRLIPARDVSQLRALQDGTTGLTGAEAQALITRAHDGDAAIFIVAPNRQDQTVGYRLQAITSDAACKATSAAFEAAVAGSGAANVDRVVEAALKQFEAATTQTSGLTICPVQTTGGYSACADVLGNRLTALATKRAGGATRILTGNRFHVSTATAQCQGDDGNATLRTRLGHDPRNGAWLELEFAQGPQILSAMPRTRVDLGALACDPTLRSLPDYIAASTRRDRTQLDIAAAATPFRPGQRLEVRIDLGAPAALYCWVLAPDETAFIALPATASNPEAQGALIYPTSFGLRQIVLDGAFENLFHCFAAPAPIPQALDAQWRDLGPAGGNPRLLDRAQIEQILAQMRAQPGLTEATARIVVR